MAEFHELSIGVSALDFTLEDSTGIEISLSSYREKSKVYLFFIREYN